LLYLGRWHPNKGVDLLLDSLDRLDASDWALIEDLHIAGGGPLQDLVHERVGSLAAQGYPVRLSGYLDKKGATEALGRADYLLLPSRVESIPVVFSDAMKAGLPIVASPVGDIPDLMTELSVGVLADEVSAESYSRAIRSALRQSPRAFGENLKQMAGRFDIRGIADRIVRDLLGSAGNC